MSQNIKYFNEKIPFSFLGFDSSFFYDEGGFYANGGDPIGEKGDLLSVVEMILNSRYINNNFYDFLDVKIFDPTFINRFYLRCFNHAADHFKNDLSCDILKNLELYKEICEGKRPLISNQDAKDLSKRVLENLRKDNKLSEHLIFFTRGICSSLTMGENYNSAIDSATAIARFLSKKNNKDKFEFNDHFFLKAWESQKTILINDVFKNYPEQTSRYLEIKDKYQIKELLRL